jgi:lipid II:glycine glycyltransferase (peptidoglycan interpeptide bridge formation enzyme)
LEKINGFLGVILRPSASEAEESHRKFGILRPAKICLDGLRMTPMELTELSLSKKEQYNQFVANSPSGSFLQSWEWGDWQAQLGRQIFRYKISDDSGSQIASAQLVKTPLPFGKYYLYAPYGPVGAANYELGSKNYDWMQELRKKFPAAIFIRIEPKDVHSLQPTTYNLNLVKSVNIQPAITMLVGLHDDADKILAAMHPKTRYNIKIAEKNGVAVAHELVVTPKHGLYIQEAVNLILETQKRQHYHGHNAEYYKRLIDFFAVHNLNGDLKLRIYRATYQKLLLVSAIMMDFGKSRVYLFGGSSDSNKNVMAPYLLHWQAMLDAKAMGLEYYDLGGSEVSGGGEKGFTRFKRGFGGRVVEYAGAYDIVINKSLYQVYRFLRSVNKIVKKTSSG